MHIRTWPAANPKHLYVQVNANKYDSDLPYAQDERNLAFNEQTTQPGTPIGCWIQKKLKVEIGCQNRPPYAH